MAAFTFTSPDGKSYTVNGPDGATKEQAFAMLQGQLSKAPPAQQSASDSAADQFAAGGSFSNTDEASGFGAGLPEGVKRAWGGVKQLGADLSDAGKTFFSGTPSRTAPDQNGISQPLPSSSGAQATDAENQRQAQATAAQPPAQQPGFGVGAATGQALAQSAIPVGGELGLGATAGRATTYVGNALRQTALGAAGGAANFSPTNDKGADIAVGGAFGAGLSILNPIAAIKAVLNKVGKATNAAATGSSAALDAAQPAMEFGQGDNPSPTFAMATGAPTARTMEAGSFNGTLQNKYAELSDHFLDQFKIKLDQPGVGGQTLDSSFLRAQTQADRSLSQLRRAASQDYEKGMSDASALASRVSNTTTPPGPRTIDAGTGAVSPGSTTTIGARVQATNFQQQLNVIHAQDTDTIGGSGAMPKEWMQSVMDRLQQPDRPTGTLSVQDTAGVLRRLTALQQDDNPETRALASKLKDSFNTDLDLTANDSSASHPAVKQVLDTRAAYNAAQNQIRGVEQSAAYRFLGMGPNDNVTPEQLVGRYSALEPDKQAQVADYMRRNTPDLLQLMRRKVVSDATNAATQNASPASNSQVDVGSLVDSVFKNGQVRSSGLWNADELKMLESFRQGARVLSNVGQKVTGGAGTIVGPAEVVPNIISANPIFASRQIARALQGAKGADLFTDPKLYSMFQRMNRATDGPTQAALRNAIVSRIGSVSGSDQTQSPPSQ